MVDDALAPDAAQLRIVHPRQDGRVLDGDHRLIIEAVQRPGLHLLLVELAVSAAAYGTDAGCDSGWRRCRAAGFSSSSGVRRLFKARSSSRRNRPPSRRPRPISRSLVSATRTGLVLLIWTNMRRPMSTSAQTFDRAAVARHRHVTHATGTFVTEPSLDHLVVGPERPVEEQGVGAFDPALDSVRHLGAARNIEHALAAGDRISSPTVVSVASPIVIVASSSQSGTLPGTANISTLTPGTGSKARPSSPAGAARGRARRPRRCGWRRPTFARRRPWRKA